MKNFAETPLILPAKRPRECVSQGIADRIGMAQPFALDDLETLINALKLGYQQVIQGPVLLSRGLSRAAYKIAFILFIAASLRILSALLFAGRRRGSVNLRMCRRP